MSELIYGIDISNNNGNVDLASVKNAGVQYVYMKAGEGSRKTQPFTDSYLPQFNKQCRNLGLKCGAYYFLRIGNSGAEQAKHFINIIKNYSWDLIPMLDIEVPADDFGFTVSKLCSTVKDFILTFEELYPVKLGIYIATGYMSNLKSISSMLSDRLIWVAEYSNRKAVLEVSNILFGKLAGHQYSDCGSYGNFTGDCNVFLDSILISKQTRKGTWILDKKENKWWYKHSDGSYTKSGWEWIDNNWYLFNDKGWMLSYWQQEGGNWYYLYSNGAMAKGWVKNNNDWYYMNDKGAMVVGWQKINGDWYHFNKDGSMATGWIRDNGKDYLLYSNGKMASDIDIYGYHINSEGIAKML